MTDIGHCLINVKRPANEKIQLYTLCNILHKPVNKHKSAFNTKINWNHENKHKRHFIEVTLLTIKNLYWRIQEIPPKYSYNEDIAQFG